MTTPRPSRPEPDEEPRRRTRPSAPPHPGFGLGGILLGQLVLGRARVRTDE